MLVKTWWVRDDWGIYRKMGEEGMKEMGEKTNLKDAQSIVKSPPVDVRLSPWVTNEVLGTLLGLCLTIFFGWWTVRGARNSQKQNEIAKQQLEQSKRDEEISRKAAADLAEVHKENKKRIDLELRNRLLFEFSEVEYSTLAQYYVDPLVSRADPNGTVLERAATWDSRTTREVIQHTIFNNQLDPYLMLMADTGMGKSSIAVRLFFNEEYVSLFKSKNLRAALMPCKTDDIFRKIDEIPNKDRTVLILDAFDEDPLATKSKVERFRALLGKTAGFRAVIITCRTQFWPSEADAPVATGVRKIINGPSEKLLQIAFLLPFDDARIDDYLALRLPKLQDRLLAEEVVKKCKDLFRRPMLLAGIPDLIESPKLIEKASLSSSIHSISSVFDITLYFAELWFVREQHWIAPADLRNFSERLAIAIFTRQIGDGESVDPLQFKTFCENVGLALKQEELKARSLLIRDYSGNVRFAHRSFLEYFFVCAALRQENEDGDPRYPETWSVERTDHMDALILDFYSSTRFQNISAKVSNKNLGMNAEVLELVESNKRSIIGAKIASKPLKMLPRNHETLKSNYARRDYTNQKGLTVFVLPSCEVAVIIWLPQHAQLGEGACIFSHNEQLSLKKNFEASVVMHLAGFANVVFRFQQSFVNVDGARFESLTGSFLEPDYNKCVALAKAIVDQVAVQGGPSDHIVVCWKSTSINVNTSETFETFTFCNRSAPFAENGHSPNADLKTPKVVQNAEAPRPLSETIQIKHTNYLDQQNRIDSNSKTFRPSDYGFGEGNNTGRNKGPGA
jgi:hypothetical protein